MKRYIETDPLTGAVETFEFDEDGDHAMVHRSFDDTKAINHNKRLQNEWDGWNDDKTRRLAARIPIDVCYIWLTKHGVDIFNKNHQKGVERLLNDPEWRYLRIGHFII